MDRRKIKFHSKQKSLFNIWKLSTEWKIRPFAFNYTVAVYLSINVSMLNPSFGCTHYKTANYCGCLGWVNRPKTFSLPKEAHLVCWFYSVYEMNSSFILCLHWKTSFRCMDLMSFQGDFTWAFKVESEDSALQTDVRHT